MKAFVGVTDGDWFELLASQASIEEVNFWQPGGSRVFRALSPGELFLFKLHSPNDFIVGGGVFAYANILPVDLAWDAFGLSNGARTLAEMRARIEKYRRKRGGSDGRYQIGCILLQAPFFLPRERWIPAPADWSKNIVQGKTYDLESHVGRQLQRALLESGALGAPPEQAQAIEPFGGHGRQRVYLPRLGQGTFRVLVTEAYARRCAFTGERTLPALEAAHIRPFELEKKHRVENGLLMRRDLHALFDRGYLTVTPGLHVEVSRKIREDYENGRDYYAMHGKAIREPEALISAPDEASLRWHNEHVFLS